MKTEPAIKDLYQTVRTMINDLNNVTISEEREEEIHEFYVRYSSMQKMDSKYLLENCVQCPVFDDPPLYVYYDSILELETAYQRFQSIGTIEDSK